MSVSEDDVSFFGCVGCSSGRVVSFTSRVVSVTSRVVTVASRVVCLVSGVGPFFNRVGSVSGLVLGAERAVVCSRASTYLRGIISSRIAAWYNIDA